MVETKLISKSSSTPYKGLIINRSATAKGVLSIEGSGSDIVGVELSSRLTQIDSILTDPTQPLRELELKINAGSGQAIGILRHSGRIQKHNIRISEFIGNDQSCVFKNESSENLLDFGATIEVGEKVNLKKNIAYGFYSNLKDAKYIFSTNSTTTAISPNDINADYSGMLVLDDISVQGNFDVLGEMEWLIHREMYMAFILFQIPKKKQPRLLLLTIQPLRLKEIIMDICRQTQSIFSLMVKIQFLIL